MVIRLFKSIGTLLWFTSLRTSPIGKKTTGF